MIGKAIRSLDYYLNFGTLNLFQNIPLSLYIHIPWCLKKCPYCDFNSHEFNNNLPEEEYIKALITDLESSLHLIWGRKTQSIFIGGGTPSLFKAENIDKLISQIRSRLNILPDCEITLEVNPGTFEKNKFKDFKQAGINRLSLGIQSFNNNHLKLLGRVHNSKQAKLAIDEAKLYFDNFNLDIMYALPNQNIEDLILDIKTALNFDPPHISIYNLTIEKNTYFYKYNPQNLPNEDIAYEMLDIINDLTNTSEMNRYEISAYSLLNKQCLHNLNYWQFGDYLGIGSGSHSKLSFKHKIIRQSRISNPQIYIENALNKTPLNDEKEVKRKDLPFEFMLNNLRLSDGFNLNNFVERTGLSISVIENKLNIAENQGLIIIKNDNIKATKLGFDFLNDLQELFLPD